MTNGACRFSSYVTAVNLLFLDRNFLYVYPQSVNFSSRGGSARNIAIKIQIMEKESEQDAMKVSAPHGGMTMVVSSLFEVVIVYINY